MTDAAALAHALSAVGLLEGAPSSYPAITGVTDDSRLVEPGMLFCAVKGTADDGHRYAAHAVERGAALIMGSRRVDVAVPQILVTDGRRAASIAAARWYGEPGASLRIVAVTGTNGKSTSVALVRHLLNRDGDVASLGTLGAVDPRGEVLPGHDHLTTPGTVELQQVLAALRGRGARTVVMESSSHALDQGRLAELRVAAALFTNLTHEHLDYHGTLAAYRAAKLRLLDLLTEEGLAVLNGDDPAWDPVTVEYPRRVLRYSTGRNADVRVLPHRADALGTDVQVSFGDVAHAARLPIPGQFNLSNAAGAAAVAWGLGYPSEIIADRLASSPQVLGRLERLVDGRVVVLRDYAHTPDALERVLAALRPLTAGRLVVLFGAGGDRDRAKRPEMGRIAERLADLVFVTSDNPRTEDPHRIIDDIERGMQSRDHRRVVDRREAIGAAIAELRDGDCLVLAGKGHETYQVVGTERIPFDERAIVAELMEGR